MDICNCCVQTCIGTLITGVVIGWFIYKYLNSLSFKRKTMDYFPLLLLFIIAVLMFTIFRSILKIGDKELISFLGTISALLIGLIVYRAQNRLLISQIANRVAGELIEIYRHLGANLEVLDKIEPTKGVPSILHIKKLGITKYSSLSDEMALRNLDKQHNQLIFPMTVRVRNYNINVDTIVEYLKSPDKKQETFSEYKNNIYLATKTLQKHIKECLEKMDVNIELPYSQCCDTTMIIYDAQWKSESI